MDGQYKRNSEILNRKLIHITIPAILAEICTIACVATDSVVAQHFIDNRSVAAIAILATLMIVFRMAHDLLGSCTTILLSRIKCERSNEEASRTFADIILIVSFIYVFIAIVIFAGGRYFLEFLTDDRALIDLAWAYYLPILFATPLLEVLLMVERGMKTEGNVAYFAARPIISNVLNILLDLLFVVVFNKGIVWIAFATVLSSALGYVWSLSYPLFRPCNLRPDFKGIMCKQRLINTAREQIKIGSSYFLGDIIELVNTALTAKFILLFGGSIAMVSYGIMKNINTVIYGLVYPIVGNSNILFSALFAEQDRKGIKTVSTITLTIIIGFSGIFLVAMVAFPEMFAYIYDVVDEEQFRSMRICMYTFGFVILWKPLGYYIRTSLISMKKERLSTIIAVVEQLLQMAMVLGAALTGSIVLIWIAMGWSSCIIVIAAVCVSFRKKRLSRELPDSDFVGYTIKLSAESISTISEDVCRLLIENGVKDAVSRKSGLIIEECSMIILQENEDRQIMTDIRVRITDDNLKIYFYYDGRPIMDENKLREKVGNTSDNLEIIVLKGITESSKHVQIVELNCLEFSVANN